MKASAPLVVALTCALAAPAVSQDKPSQEKIDFHKQVMPIFKARCIECHGPDEQEADLRLDQKGSVFHDGGPSEWIVVPGKAAESVLYERIILPVDDPDVMPNEGDPLTKAQIAVIRDWIAQGADWPDDGSAVPDEPKADTALVLPALSDADKAGQQRALESIRKRGALAMPIAQNTSAVSVSFSLVGGDVKNGDLALLGGLESTLVWLNASRTGIDSGGLQIVAKYPELRRLNLSQTKVGDDGLAHLGGLAHLDYLNLYGTEVTDAGLEHLQGLTRLRKLYLWQTRVTEAGAKRLGKKIPGLEIDLGRYAEQIREVARARQPVNDKCPLTGKPIDRAFTVIYKDQVVALCCEKCRAKFAADPAKFADKIVKSKSKSTAGGEVKAPK